MGVFELEFAEKCADRTSQTCTNFINSAYTALKNDALNAKDSSMAKTLVDFSRTADMDVNAMTYGIRNANLLNSQAHIKAYNNSITNNTQHDVDLSKRQFEINEYYYYNKLDTLFFLQVFFISAMIMAILIYAFRRGMLTAKMSGLITVGLAIIVVIIGISRYYYTARVRDKRLWHRRHFGNEGDAKDRPEFITTCPGPSIAPVINLNAIVSGETTQCLAETKTIFNNWVDTMNQATQNTIDGASVSLDSVASVGSTCRRR
jgi:hypothetical protein